MGPGFLLVVVTKRQIDLIGLKSEVMAPRWLDRAWVLARCLTSTGSGEVVRCFVAPF
jgi:hypothetical protein